MKSRDIQERMKTILVRDKLGVGDGFMSVFKTELSRLASDYFDFDREIDVAVELVDNGKYQVKISFTANNTKSFCSTQDMKRGIY